MESKDIQKETCQLLQKFIELGKRRARGVKISIGTALAVGFAAGVAVAKSGIIPLP